MWRNSLSQNYSNFLSYSSAAISITKQEPFQYFQGDIRQAKHLAVLYQITLDELIDFDADQHSLQQLIDSVSEECQAKTDWTKVWSKKYPVLATYRERVAVDDYAPQLREMLTRLRAEYGYNETDALLVLKDILARTWKGDC